MGRRKKFENRFEVIVEAAAGLFEAKGFEATTMDEIAKASNLGKATLYAEFSSKEALMEAVIIWHLQRDQLAIKAQVEKAKGQYLEVLKSILFERLKTIYERANRHFHSLEVMMATVTDRTKIAHHRDEEFRILANLLEKAAANGEIAEHGNYFRQAKLLRKALRGLGPPHILNMPREEFEQDALDVIELVLAGLTVKR